MKNVERVAACCIFLLLAFTGPAWAAPENHAELLRDEDYKSGYEQYEKIMDEAKGRLSKEEFTKLKADCEASIAGDAAAGVKGGDSEAEAYSMAYGAANEHVNKELVFDWLRKNAIGIQGFYRFANNGFDGYMTVQEGSGPGIWAVSLFAIQKREPYNSGEVDGEGRPEGGGMAVNYGSDDAAATVTVVFDGETARVETSAAFKESGWLGANVLIDGEYKRERK